MEGKSGAYLGVPFYRSPGPANRNHIKHVQIALQAELPREYKTFLEVTDGCYFGHAPVKLDDGWRLSKEWGFPPPKEMNFFADIIEMSHMLSVNPANSLLNEMGARGFDRRVPSGIFPVGDNIYTNFVCLSVRREDYGNVYVWNHEDELDADSYVQTMDRMFYCAPTFNEWWISLRELEEDQ